MKKGLFTRLVTKRIIPLLLCLSLVLLMDPMLYRSYVPEKESSNIQEMLAALKAGDIEGSKGILRELGLLDKDDNIKQNEKITIDNIDYSLDEVKNMIANPNVDLSQNAVVDGCDITLSDLEKIITIEEQIAQIEEKYFSDKTFSPESTESLNSLISQMNTEGLDFKQNDSLVAQADEYKMPELEITSSDLYNHNDYCVFVDEKYSEDPSEWVIAGHLNLGDTDNLPDGWSFTLRVIGDSNCVKIQNKEFTHCEELEINATNVDVYKEMTVYIKPNVSDWEITPDSSSVLKPEGLLTNSRISQIQLCKPDGFVFRIQGQSNPSDSLDILAAGVPYQYPNGWILEYGSGGMYSMPIKQDQQSPLAFQLMSTDSPPAFFTTMTAIFGRKGEKTYKLNAKLLLKHNGNAAHYTSAAHTIYLDKARKKKMYVVPEIKNKSEMILKDEREMSVTEGKSFLRICAPGTYSGMVVGGTFTMSSELPAYIYMDRPEEFGRYQSWNHDPEAEYDYGQKVISGDYEFLFDERGYNDSLGRKMVSTESDDISLTNANITAPKVKEIRLPDGKFYPGQEILIDIVFSEPVDPSTVSLQLATGEGGVDRNTYLKDAAYYSSGSRETKHVFFTYTVQEKDDPQLIFKSISGAESIYSKIMTKLEGNDLANITIKGSPMIQSPYMPHTIKQVSVTEKGDGAEITASLESGTLYSQAYSNLQDGDFFVMAKPIDGAVWRDGSNDAYRIDLSRGETNGVIDKLTGEISELPFKTKTAQKIRLTFHVTTDGETISVVGADTEYTIDKKTDVKAEQMSIASTSGNEYELEIGGEQELPKLKATFMNNPTYTNGDWVSSDTDTALIDEDGQIILGELVGYVSFAFVPWNQHERPADWPEQLTFSELEENDYIYCVTQEYNVSLCKNAALVIPKGSATRVTQLDLGTNIYWNSSLNYYAEVGLLEQSDYTVSLYEGNITSSIGHTPVMSETVAKNKKSYKILPEHLTIISQNAVPAYSVEVKATLDGEVYSAWANIIVNPRPAQITIDEIDTIVKEGEDISFSWNIENYVKGDTRSKLSITRSYISSGVEQSEIVCSENNVEETGNYILHPKSFSDNVLKESYQIEMAVGNPGQADYNTDSIVAYVYNDNSITIDAQDNFGTDVKDDTIELSNVKKVEKFSDLKYTESNTDTTEEIIKLRETLALLGYVGIHYDTYKGQWSQLLDGIAWSVGEDEMASLSYRQAFFWNNIKSLKYETYLPETKLALTGLLDGKTTVKATHAATGVADEITVDITKLKNKMYLFHCIPSVETLLTYTDGKGEEKKVYTNSEGYLALYEKNGIASDVAVKSSYEDETYLGTIYQRNLVSGEKETDTLQLYPMNTLELRPAASIQVNLIKENEAYAGKEVIVRGGVYKNGNYCENAQIGSREAGRKITTQSDGSIRLQLDVTNFWSEEAGETENDINLTTRDKIEYVLEVTGMDGCYPQLIHIDGNTSIKENRYHALNNSYLKACSEEEGADDFIASQIMRYYTFENDNKNSYVNFKEIKDSRRNYGPSQALRKTMLISEIMLCNGKAGAGYELSIDNENRPLEDEKSETFRYPFGTYDIVRNTTTLTGATITDSGWLEEGGVAKMSACLTKNGVVQKQISLPFKFVDGLTMPDIKNAEDVTSISANLVANITKSEHTGDHYDSQKDKFVGTALSAIGAMQAGSGVNSQFFSIRITPTEDASVFQAIIFGGLDDLGLDAADYGTGNGIVLETSTLADPESRSAGIGGVDFLSTLASGSEEATRTWKNAIIEQTKKSKSFDVSFQMSGCYQAEISYNFKTEKWECSFVNGSFTAGVGLQYTYNLNAHAGPVPVTASICAGGSIQLEFKAGRLKNDGINCEDWKIEEEDKESVNDFLTSLRINAYIEAFAGVGFDYSVVALKIGIYGRIELNNENRWLSRTYLEDSSQRQLSGQALKLTGEAGIKFVAKFLFISYEAKLASVTAGYQWQFNDWRDIQTYLNNSDSGLAKSMAMGAAAYAQETGMKLMSTDTALESRDYLEENERSWEDGAASADDFVMTSQGSGIIQKNANPQSETKYLNDGSQILWLSDSDSPDLTKTRVHTGEENNNEFSDVGAIPSPGEFTGYGDSGLRVHGNEEFAAATWVRQNSDDGMNDEETTQSHLNMMSASEIVASIYNGTEWVSTRITDNTTPDLSPVIATNGKSGNDAKAIVAWRAVYSDNSEDIMDFQAQDYILYREYSNGIWDETKTLYNGNTAGVKALQVSMMEDGTAMVVYTVNPGNTDDSSRYEIGYTIVDSAGNVQATTLCTNDACTDENPQVTCMDVNDTQRFIIAWYSQSDGIGDIKFQSVMSDGTLSNQFIDSLSQVNESQNVKIGADFQFSKMDEDRNSLDKLKIMWTEYLPQDETSTGMDAAPMCLKSVGFYKKADESIALTAPSILLESEKGVQITEFDSYQLSEVDSQMVLLVSEHKEIDQNDPSTYETTMDGQGNTMILPKSESSIIMAEGRMKNEITVSAVNVDYENLTTNSIIPIQFTVRNDGYKQITSLSTNVCLEDGDNEREAQNSLELYPNESATVTAFIHTGDIIENVKYEINALFEDNSNANDEGTVRLTILDAGVSNLEVTNEQGGIRNIRMTLYNSMAAKIKDSNYVVKAALYKDADTSEQVGSTITLNNKDKEAVDAGSYSTNFSIDLIESGLIKEGEEIPDSGIDLYAKVWLENSDGNEIMEYDTNNNVQVVTITSLLERTGEAVTIDTNVVESANGMNAMFTVRNNSLKDNIEGRIITSLMDQDGNVLEQQVVGDGKILNISGEQSVEIMQTYSMKGAYIKADFVSKDIVPKRTITLDAQGGNIEQQTIKTNDYGRLEKLPAATRDGYVLEGWYTEATGGVKVTTDTLFNNDATIYAHWTKSSSDLQTVKPLAPTDSPLPKLYQVTNQQKAKNSLTMNKKSKVNWKGNNLKVAWGKVSGADGYEIRVVPSNKKLNSAKAITVTGKKSSYIVKKVNGKRLSKSKRYIMCVKAFRTIDGKKYDIGQTLNMYLAGSKDKTYTDVKNIISSQSKMSLKPKKSKKLKFKMTKVSKKKKLLTDSRGVSLRYVCSDNRIATISKKGIVKAKKKGTCYIYAIALNGVQKRVKITVK